MSNFYAHSKQSVSARKTWQSPQIVDCDQSAKNTQALFAPGTDGDGGLTTSMS